jgi:chaperonin cofactor prefoldin
MADSISAGIFKSAPLRVAASAAGGYVAASALMGAGGGIVGLVGGLVSGIVGSIFGHNRRSAIRAEIERARKLELGRMNDEMKRQRLLMKGISDDSGNAISAILNKKDYIDVAKRRLVDTRDMAISVIGQNVGSINRTKNQRLRAADMLAEKLLGEQQLEFSGRGIRMGGSTWFVMGETESMGLEAKQEIRYDANVQMVNQAMDYKKLLGDFDDMNAQLDLGYAAADLEVERVKSNLANQKEMFKLNVGAIQRQMKLLEAQQDQIKNHLRMNNQIKREAEAKMGISLAGAIRTTPVGQNPFDQLLNYGIFNQ